MCPEEPRFKAQEEVPSQGPGVRLSQGQPHPYPSRLCPQGGGKVQKFMEGPTKHFLPSPTRFPPNAHPRESLSPLSRQFPSFWPAPRIMFQSSVPCFDALGRGCAHADPRCSLFLFPYSGLSPPSCTPSLFPLLACVMKTSVPNGERSRFS